MDKKPSDHSVSTGNLTGNGSVPREPEQARRPELTPAAGHISRQGLPAEDVKATRKATHTAGADQQEAILDSIPQAKQWDPVPGSVGRQISESPSEDEDEEGRSESEQLVEGGVEQAEREQILQAARAAGKKDQREP